MLQDSDSSSSDTDKEESKEGASCADFHSPQGVANAIIESSDGGSVRPQRPSMADVASQRLARSHEANSREQIDGRGSRRRSPIASSEGRRRSRRDASVETSATSAMPSSGSLGVLEAKWEQMFGKLLDYKEQFGNTLVPNRYREDPSLGAWVSTQRRQHKAIETGRSDSSTMSRERIRRLEAIGFVWKTADPRHVPWDHRFKELLAFKDKYGHVQVPIGFEENVKLANWVSTQRQEAKLRRQGRPSRLSQDRIEKLDSVGFVWEAQRGGRRKQDERGKVLKEPKPARKRAPLPDTEEDEHLRRKPPPRQLRSVETKGVSRTVKENANKVKAAARTSTASGSSSPSRKQPPQIASPTRRVAGFPTVGLPSSTQASLRTSQSPLAAFSSARQVPFGATADLLRPGAAAANPFLQQHEAHPRSNNDPVLVQQRLQVLLNLERERNQVELIRQQYQLRQLLGIGVGPLASSITPALSVENPLLLNHGISNAIRNHVPAPNNPLASPPVSLVGSSVTGNLLPNATPRGGDLSLARRSLDELRSSSQERPTTTPVPSSPGTGSALSVAQNLQELQILALQRQIRERQRNRQADGGHDCYQHEEV